MDILGRDVWIYRPAVANRIDQLPTIIVLHGSQDFVANISNATGFQGLSETSAGGTFLTVFPEMSTPGGENWGYAEDVPFFRTLAETLVTIHNAKRTEIFVCGHSAGGTMSLFLQNNMPDVFRAAAAVESGVGTLDAWDARSSGRPVMVVWNHNDPVLKLYGGEDVLSRTLSMLRRHDTASVGPSFLEKIPLSSNESVKYAQKLSWGAGNNTPPTVIVSWESVVPSHKWINKGEFPGSFDASDQIWAFFLSSNAWEANQSNHGDKQIHA